MPDTLRISPFATILAAAVTLSQFAAPEAHCAEGERLPPPAQHEVDFHREILPILARRCVTCHAKGRDEGGLSIENRDALLIGGDSGEAVVPGRSGDSLMVHLVAGLQPDRIMPQQGKRLTDEEIGLLRAWIDQGVQWDSDVSLTTLTLRSWKPRDVELPAAGDGAANNPIDRLLAAHWTMQEKQPQRAGDRVWVRRVYLDTIGLLPTPEEVEAFVADDRPDKDRRLVRALLDDRHAYAQHWLSFWNDLLRNDYAGTGYIDGGRKQITGWLYRSLVENKPYDQFVNELIAAERGAEGFTKGIVWRGNVNASQRPPLQAAQTTAQVFLGLNLKCASCHDSFVSPWTLDDAYGLAAVFSDQPLEIYRCDKPTGRIAKPAFFNGEIGEVDLQGDRRARQQQLADLLTDEPNARLARTIVNRLWQRLMGRAIIEPVDEMDRKPWNEDLLNWLAADLQNSGYDLKRTLELILTSDQYRLQSVPPWPEDAAGAYVYAGPEVKRMTAEQFLDSVWQVTGVGPQKADANVPLPEGGRPGFVRASLRKADRLMRSLGRPPRDQVVTTRPAQLTTLQALELTNGEDLARILLQGAQQLQKKHPQWTRPQAADYVFRFALCRAPTDAETAVLVGEGEEVTPQYLADLLWTTFMLPEFQLIR